MRTELPLRSPFPSTYFIAALDRNSYCRRILLAIVLSSCSRILAACYRLHLML